MNVFSIQKKSMLEIKNLTSQVQWKNILENIDINFEIGKNYCILGENGSGKSSLALTIMWHPKYEITNGGIIVDWQKINEFTPDQKAKLWIFLAFQNIPEIPWIKLFEFLRTIYNNSTWENLTFLKFKNFIIPYLEEIWLDREFLRRDLNVWFSWWEKRKIELPYGPTIVLLGIHPRELKTYVHTQSCIWLFKTILFITAPKWK